MLTLLVMNNPILQLQQQRLLLEIEYNHEKEEFRKQTQTMGIERKTRRGDAWFPVGIGRNYYNSLNQMVVEVTRQPGSDIEHNFEPGRPVCFFTRKRDANGRDSIHYMSFTATVSYAEQDRMVVALPDSGRIVDLQRQETLGIQLFFDETSYRLMFDALDRVIRAKTGRLAALRDIFYTKAPASRFTFDAPVLPWLNASQQHAVGEVMRAKDVAIVHGPPGTGKTTTLVEAIYETLRRESQVLVCAQSNMAVDWISENLSTVAWLYCALAILHASTTRCCRSPTNGALRLIPTIRSCGAYARPYANCASSDADAPSRGIRRWTA